MIKLIIDSFRKKSYDSLSPTQVKIEKLSDTALRWSGISVICAVIAVVLNIINLFVKSFN